MKDERYITIKGLNQAITNKITSEERLSLYKAWKKYVKSWKKLNKKKGGNLLNIK